MPSRAHVEKYPQDFSLLLADERYLQQVAGATKAPAGGALPSGDTFFLQVEATHNQLKHVSIQFR